MKSPTVSFFAASGAVTAISAAGTVCTRWNWCGAGTYGASSVAATPSAARETPNSNCDFSMRPPELTC